MTTVPLQQLFVLNSEFMVRNAKALAASLTSDAGQSDAERVQKACDVRRARRSSSRRCTTADFLLSER